MRRIAMMVLICALAVQTFSYGFEIKGTVVDAKTKKPANDVQIIVEHHENRNSDHPDKFQLTGKVDDKGVFSLSVTDDDKSFMVMICDKDGNIYDGRAHVDGKKALDFEKVEIAKDCELNGKVKDPAGKSRADVNVKLSYRFPKLNCNHYIDVKTVKSGPDGSFAFKNIPAAVYAVEVEADNINAPINQEIKVGDSFCYMELMQILGASIKGQVSDAEGKPLAGIQITSGKNKVTSDAKGAYEMKGLPEGEIYLQIVSDDYVSVDRKPVSVKKGDTKEKNFKLEKAGSLELTFKGLTPDIIIPDSVDVSMTRMRLNVYVNKEADVKDAVALIKGIGPGSYDISISSKEAAEYSTNVVIKSSETAKLLIICEKTYSFKGSVANDKGAIVKDVSVSLSPDIDEKEMMKNPRLYASMYRRSMYASVKDDGTFEIKTIKPGNYILKIEHDDYSVLTEKVKIGQDGKAEGKFVLTKGLTISGNIMDSEGKPVSGMDVSIYGPKSTGRSQYMGGSVSKNVTTKDDGTFEISGLSSGKYQLSVYGGSGEGARETIASMDNISAGSGDIVISVGKKYDVEVVVKTTDGKPLAGADVMSRKVEDDNPMALMLASQFSTGESGLKTDESGKFKLKLIGGTKYQVSASLSPYLPANKVIDLSTPSAAASVKVVELALEKGAEISGKVISSKDKKPLSGLKVIAGMQFDMYQGRYSTDEEEGSPEKAEKKANVTDAEGRFKVEGVQKGIVTLSVIAKGKKPTAIMTKKLQVADKSVTNVVIEVGEMGSLKGKIIGRDGKPLEDAQISIQRKTDGSFDNMAEMMTSYMSAQSDEKGEFNMENLMPGDYTVQSYVMAGEDEMTEGDVSEEDAMEQYRTRMTKQRIFSAKVKVEEGKCAEVTLTEKKKDAKTESTAPTITGKVTKNGKAVDKGSIMLAAKVGKDVKTEESESDDFMSSRGGYMQGAISNGVFTVKKVKPGKYNVMIYEMAKGDSDEESMSGRDMKMLSAVLQVENGKTNYDINVTGVMLKGVVQDKSGAPIAEAYVILQKKDENNKIDAASVKYVQSDDNGQYSMDCVADGTYMMSVRTEKGSAIKKDVKISGKDSVVDIKIGDGFNVYGKIDGVENKQSSRSVFPGTMVLIIDPQDETTPISYSIVKPDGTYTGEVAVAAGEYKVVVYSEGYAMEVQKVKVAKDTEFNAKLIPGGDIKIVVKNADGTPAGDKEVNAKTASGEEVVRFKPGEEDMSMGSPDPYPFNLRPTNKSGVTSIKALKPGKYTVGVKDSKKTVDVEVKALETVTAEITL